jgi:dihydrolipoamide dehydrogenase
MRDIYDVVVMGGGTAGYVAALRASQLGGKVALVEREKVGGTCLRRGCIPSKALLTSSEAYIRAKNASEFGITVGSVEANIPEIIARKDKIVDTLTRGVEFLLKRAGVQVIYGSGRFIEPQVIEVESNTSGSVKLAGRSVIICTGSEPAQLPGLEFDGRLVLNSTDALNLQELPNNMLIIGAGALGCEFGTFYADLGSEVTIVEMLPHVLPAEDDEIAHVIDRELRKKLIKVRTGVKVDKVTKGAKSVQIDLSDGQVVSAERILVSVGRSFNSVEIGLDKAGAKVERGRIVVNSRMETGVPNIYAAGDITGGWLLAHVASTEGTVAAFNAMGQPREMDYRVIPRCTFTSPEVASVGLTEKQAREAGIEIVTGVFPLRASGRAMAMGAWQGKVKLIADSRNDRLIGAHIASAHASELIGELVLAMDFEATIEDLERVVRAHPSLVEAIGEAADALHGRPLHS